MGNTKDDDDEGESTRVRWFMDVVRYAAAALVTTVTVAVIVRAVTVSLRSETLDIKVAHASVFVSVKGSPPAPLNVSFSLTLLSHNPSGRVGVQYSHVNVTLLDDTSEAISWFTIGNGLIYGIFVGPETVRRTLVRAVLSTPDDVPQAFAERMRVQPHHGNGTTSAGQEIRGAVHLNGTLQTQISGSGLTYSRGRNAKFRCFPVTIGVLPLNLSAGDASCHELPP